MRTLQPNSQKCFVCGMGNPFGLHFRFYNTASGEVTAEHTLPEQYQGYPGVVHGGIIAAMLDEAAGRAHMSVDDASTSPPRFMFTARLNIRYRKNVPVGQPLRLVGKVSQDENGKASRRTAASTAYIYNQQGDLLAEADALLVDIPGDRLVSSDLEALGWKVYPE